MDRWLINYWLELFYIKQPKGSIAIIGTEPNSPLPVYQTLVRPAMPASEVGMSPGAQRRTGNRTEWWGMSLKALLAIFGLPETRMILPDNLPQTRYDVSVVLPDANTESYRAAMRQVIAAVFGVGVRRESRQMDVLLLRKASNGPTGLQPSDKGRTLQVVADLAESVLKRVVIDDTGLPDKYVFVLAYPKSEQEFLTAIKALGLDLIPDDAR